MDVSNLRVGNTTYKVYQSGVTKAVLLNKKNNSLTIFLGGCGTTLDKLQELEYLSKVTDVLFIYEGYNGISTPKEQKGSLYLSNFYKEIGIIVESIQKTSDYTYTYCIASSVGVIHGVSLLKSETININHAWFLSSPVLTPFYNSFFLPFITFMSILPSAVTRTAFKGILKAPKLRELEKEFWKVTKNVEISSYIYALRDIAKYRTTYKDLLGQIDTNRCTFVFGIHDPLRYFTDRTLVKKSFPTVELEAHHNIVTSHPQEMLRLYRTMVQ